MKNLKTFEEFDDMKSMLKRGLHAADTKKKCPKCNSEKSKKTDKKCPECGYEFHVNENQHESNTGEPYGYPSSSSINQWVYPPITKDEIEELRKVDLIRGIPSEYAWYHDKDRKDIINYIKDYRSPLQIDARTYNM